MKTQSLRKRETTSIDKNTLTLGKKYRLTNYRKVQRFLENTPSIKFRNRP